MSGLTSCLFQDADRLLVGNPPNGMLKQIPPGFWRVQVDPKLGFYLQAIPAFTLPPKLYGDASEVANRVFNTFTDRIKSYKNTGCLLVGEPGSGKSMTAKLLSMNCVNAGFPLVMVDRPYNGAALQGFFDNFNQPFVVFIDEFEKVYEERKDQESLLPLLDGTASSRVLYLMTANNSSINTYMRNRPGRVFYKREYKGITVAFAKEYCDDKLIDKSHIGAVQTLVATQGNMNFDMLQALVEEMNRYKETVSEALQYLSIDQSDNRNNAVYKVIKAVYRGREIELDRLYTHSYTGKSMTYEFRISNYFMVDPSAKFGGKGYDIMASLYKPRPVTEMAARDLGDSNPVMDDMINGIHEDVDGILDDLEEEDEEEKKAALGTSSGTASGNTSSATPVGWAASKKFNPKDFTDEISKLKALMASRGVSEKDPKYAKALQLREQKLKFDAEPVGFHLNTVTDYHNVSADGSVITLKNSQGDELHLQVPGTETTPSAFRRRMAA